jgi:hypothetical protein
VTPQIRFTAAVLGTPDPQPHEDVRVYADPAGHPFCLFPRLD